MDLCINSTYVVRNLENWVLKWEGGGPPQLSGIIFLHVVLADTKECTSTTNWGSGWQETACSDVVYRAQKKRWFSRTRTHNIKYI